MPPREPRIISAEEARALREGRESKGAWDAGAEAVYAGHDTCPRHKAPGDGGDLTARCECRAIGAVDRDGDRNLAAAAPDLAATVEHLHARAERAERAATDVEKERDEALRGVIPRGYVALTSIDAAAAIVDAELVRHLRAIIEGRTTTPTEAEIAAHDHAGGWWLFLPGRGIGRCSCSACRTAQMPAGELLPGNVRMVAAAGGGRWWALDAQRRPCAWPVVTEAP